MVRRLIVEDPFSRAAIWSRNLAIFAFLVAVIGIGLARRGLDPTAALAIELGAIGLSGFSILFALVAMAVIWRTGFRGIGLALGGLVLSGLLLVYPTYVVVQARTVPPVADVSTDLDDPPSFLATEKALDARRDATPPPMGAADKALQTKLYPDLDTLTLDADVMDVDKIVHKVLRARHWQIVDEVKPINFATGHIDVVLKSAVMGFPADLTIRLRGIGNQTKVDVRSVSRAGWQEQPGSNAVRVQSLVDDIDAATDAS